MLRQMEERQRQERERREFLRRKQQMQRRRQMQRQRNALHLRRLQVSILLILGSVPNTAQHFKDIECWYLYCRR